MTAKLQLKESETELKQTQSKFSESSESCTNLKNLLEATQQVKHGLGREDLARAGLKIRQKGQEQ